jgi:hypothetical protein
MSAQLSHILSMVTDSTKYGTTAPLQAAPIRPHGALQMQIQATQQPNHDALGCTTASATTAQLHSTTTHSSC